MLRKLLVGAALAAVSISVSAATKSRPDGYVTICKAGETCSVASPSMVAFGASDLFVYKVLRGSFVCSAHTFGTDPNRNNPAKECSISESVSKPATALAASGAVLGSSSSSSGGSPVQATPLETGRYAIVSRLSGKTLTVDGLSETDGAKIVQGEEPQADSLYWDVTDLGNGYYSVRAAATGKSLDVHEWNTNDGAEVRQIEWINSWNQHWTIQSVGNGYYSVVSRFSGKSLDVYEMSKAKGTDIRLWTYWGGENQQWGFVPAGAASAGE